MKKFMIPLLAFLLPLGVYAAEEAYVIKQDGKQIYLDVTEMSAAPAAGTVLKLVESEETLKSVKGEVIGSAYKYGPKAVVTQKEEKFVIAELEADYKTKHAQKAVIEKPAPRALPAAFVPAEKAPVKAETRAPLLRTLPAEGKIISLCQADIYGDGNKYFIAGGEKNEVKVYSAVLNGKKQQYQLEEKEKFNMPAFGTLINLSCADVKGSGKEQVFAVSLDKNKNEIRTHVLEGVDGKLQKTGSFKWAVKTVYNPAGNKVLGQDVYYNGGLKARRACELSYAKNKFTCESLKTKVPGEASVFSLNYGGFDEDGKNDFLTVRPTGDLTVYLSGGKKISSGLDINFSGTPAIYGMGRDMLKIRTPLFIRENEPGNISFLAVENIPKIGLVAGSFGLYKSSKIHFLHWDGFMFAEQGTIDLAGIAPEILEGEIGGVKGILLPVVLETGNTIIEIY